jgi:hypothetical protein
MEMKARSATIFDKDDIRRAAYSMIGNHGRLAAQVAAQRASHLIGDDLKESRMMWEQIARAIDKLQPSPPSSHRVH